MWPLLLFLPLFAFAQDDLDLSAIQDLDTILPDDDIQRDAYRNVPFERKNREYRPPVRKVDIPEIRESGTEYSYVKEGTVIYRISDNKAFRISREMYLKRFQLEDELNFVYLEGKDGSMTYKVPSRYVHHVKEEMKLYEPPTRWSPAPENMVRTEFDRKLKLAPEVAFYAGIVQSNYVRDLFNDPKARAGSMNQYAAHLFTEWNLPFKVGGAVHYERSSYTLSRGGNVFYQAVSFGPQFRTKDFDLFETNWRLTTQIRISPFAKMHGETANGNVDFKFNSTDLMTTVEHPWSNGWGQFVLGAFHQIQWLDFRDQPEIVSVRASNKTNQGFGLFLAQVFE